MSDAPTGTTHAGVHNFRPQMTSRKLDMKTGVAAGFFWDQALGGYLLGAGTTVPTDGDTGWAESCRYSHTDGGAANQMLYVNIGDGNSCDFDAITDASFASDVANTANGKGASLVGVEDSGSIITGATVEAALAELAGYRTAQALSSDTSASVEGIATLNGTASCDVTLANGAIIGTRKMFRAITSIANPPTVTVATHELGTSVVYSFATIGDSLKLEWDGLQWITVGGNAQLIEALATDTAALTFGLTTLNGTASNDVTLADALIPGTRKFFRAVTSIANPPTVTVATHEMGVSRAVYTFNTIGDSLELVWDGLQWVHVAGIQPIETATGSFTLSPFYITDIDSNGGAVTGTLGDGAFPGQIKVITNFVDASTSSVVSLTNHQTSDPEEATFDALDETGVFLWTGTEWITLFSTCTFV